MCCFVRFFGTLVFSDVVVAIGDGDDVTVINRVSAVSGWGQWLMICSWTRTSSSSARRRLTATKNCRPWVSTA